MEFNLSSRKLQLDISKIPRVSLDKQEKKNNNNNWTDIRINFWAPGYQFSNFFTNFRDFFRPVMTFKILLQLCRSLA